MDWFIDFLVRHKDGTEEAYFILTHGKTITEVLVHASQLIYERFGDEHFFINHVWASARDHGEQVKDTIMLDTYKTLEIYEHWGVKW